MYLMIFEINFALYNFIFETKESVEHRFSERKNTQSKFSHPYPFFMFFFIVLVYNVFICTHCEKYVTQIIIDCSLRKNANSFKGLSLYYDNIFIILIPFNIIFIEQETDKTLKEIP